jgi:aspartate aminotransferase-like enzyme
MCEWYGADVTRLDVEWGRACDPDALRRALDATPADAWPWYTRKPRRAC